jgi:hypothetical protein
LTLSDKPSIRDAHNGYLWLRENENKFEKKVYGPVALEVYTIPPPTHHRGIQLVGETDGADVTLAPLR